MFIVASGLTGSTFFTDSLEKRDFRSKIVATIFQKTEVQSDNQKVEIEKSTEIHFDGLKAGMGKSFKDIPQRENAKR